MNIPELIKKIKEAQEDYRQLNDSKGENKLDEVIKELEQQIDDGK